MERIQQIRNQFGETFSALSVAQKAGIASALALTIAALGWIVASASSTPYATLFANMPESQLARVIDELDTRGVPYELRGNSTILVPQDQVYATRIQLVGNGLASSEGKGYELFDNTEFGVPTLIQNINYNRAMETELARSISQLEAVQAARVHLVRPEDTLFEEDEVPPSASVVLDLQYGVRPDSSEIDSIRFLVAGAVEGLLPEAIAIVDSAGNVLARPDDETGAGTGRMVEAARELELSLQQRVLAVLEPIVGYGKVRTSIAVDLDTSERVETAEEYDPDVVAVLSEQVTEETSNRETTGAGGAAGAVANLQAGGGDGQDSDSESSVRTNSNTVFGVNNTVRQRVQSGYTVERISVAVVVDGVALGAAGAAPPVAAAAAPAEGAEGEAAAVAIPPRAFSQAELANLSALVESAVGFDSTRGDRVTLEPFAFVGAQRIAPAAQPVWSSPSFFVPVLRYALLGFGMLLLFGLVVRPVMKLIVAKPERAEAASDTQMIVRTVAELEAEGLRPTEADIYEELRQRVMELTAEDTDRASEVITEWIRVDAV